MNTSREHQPLERDVKPVRETWKLVIAAENTYAEEQYFNTFRSDRIEIIVLPTVDGHSSPNHVLARLERYKNGVKGDDGIECDFEPGDRLWMAVDFDRGWKRHLAIAAPKCEAQGFGMAVSNPTFELWLALHLDDAPPKWPTSQALEKHLRACLGSYDKTNIRPERFAAGRDRAYERAKALDRQPDDDWPQRTGTRVYRIIDDIRAMSLTPAA